jgi:predicted DCC family thiol-disulfide oxidoreductase YuxK
MSPNQRIEERTRPVLLFNDECGVCRRIARWVTASAQSTSGEPSIVVRPIGDDPETLRALNGDLDIWDAYETIHLLMPDGSMKLGGEACAEVLRRLPNTTWFSWAFSKAIFGLRPFQLILDMGYTALADVRPIFGCESCGTPSAWLKPLAWTMRRSKALFGAHHHPAPSPHFTVLSPAERTAGT